MIVDLILILKELDKVYKLMIKKMFNPVNIVIKTIPASVTRSNEIAA